MAFVVPPQYLVVASSGRALARSAHYSGHSVCVLDLFADTDTLRYSSICKKISASGWGLDVDSTLAAANQYCPPPMPLVPGSGFENNPGLLGALSSGRPLLGNRPETVAFIKDPTNFFAMLDDLGIPHPLTSLLPPISPDGWLVKTVGANGGSHIRHAQRDDKPEKGKYFQEFVKGRAASVLFLANGFQCRVIGLNETWCRGGTDAPFAYAGAINRIDLPEKMRDRIQADVRALVRELGLTGINGMDLIVTSNDYQVLEVNPRPTATLDLYDDQASFSLFKMHVAACHGELPTSLPDSNLVRAHAVVYAPKTLHLPLRHSFPDWCTDLPAEESTFHSHDPICMAHAQGSRVDAVKRLLEYRRRNLLNLLTG